MRDQRLWMAGRLAGLLLLAILVLTAGAAIGQPDASGLPQSPLRIIGTVRAPNGPAEGVRVLLELRDMRNRAPEYFAETRTDQAGHFEFDISQFNWPEYGIELIIISPRYVQTGKIVRAGRAQMPVNVELEVEPGTVVRGVTVDGEGNPLPDVEIYAPVGQPQKSDAEGKWEVFGIPSGYAQLRFIKEGYSDNYVTVQPTEPEIIEGVEVVMESARELKGVLVNWEDEPVKYGLVIFQDKERYLQRTTDEEGRFTFSGVPERTEGLFITAMAEGYLPTEHKINAEEANTLELRVVIDSGVYVSGQVLFPSGEPASGAVVVAGNRVSRSAPQAETDPEGRWRLGPFPPKYEEIFTALPPNMEASWAVADLVIRDGSKPGYFKGEVELWPKGFASDFEIKRDGNNVRMIRRDDGPGGVSSDVVYEGVLDPATNKVTGTVELAGLKQRGTFEMKANSFVPGSLVGEWQLSEEIEPSEMKVAPVQTKMTMPLLTGTVEKTIQLTEALTLSGRALRADGAPFVDGHVIITGWNDTDVYSPRSEIGIGGRFAFDRVPNGVFRIFAISENGDYRTPALFARGGITDLVLREGEPEADPMDE